MSPSKISKEEANYRQGREDYKCSLCTMYRSHLCTKVAGHISPSKVCDYFDPK